MPAIKSQFATAKRFPKTTPAGDIAKSPSELIGARIAALPDWRGDLCSRLFNSNLDGKVRRAVDFPEGCEIDEAALKALIRATIAVNSGSPVGKAKIAGWRFAASDCSPVARCR